MKQAKAKNSGGSSKVEASNSVSSPGLIPKSFAALVAAAAAGGGSSMSMVEMGSRSWLADINFKHAGSGTRAGSSSGSSLQLSNSEVEELW